jgi:hypothetical protein
MRRFGLRGDRWERIKNLLPGRQRSVRVTVQPLGQKRCLGADVQHLAADADNEYAMIDNTVVHAHQHSAGAQEETARTRRPGARAAD